MPQGPKGRGCEACRAQKKKCDLAQPACSRCQKLRIVCTGCGQQRFKFLSTFLPPPPARIAPSPIPAPSNETTSLQHNVVQRLQASDDIRYHMGFRWGSFLNEIPRRLGNNDALDTAATALLARHSETSMRQDQSDPRAPAATEYNLALRALQKNLAEGHGTAAPEILCAVLLLAYCQARFDDQFTFFWSPHGRGLTQLLRMRDFKCGGTHFDKHLFPPLASTVILQSFANPHVCLSTGEYRQLQAILLEVAPTAGEAQHWILMIQISELMARARRAIGSSSSLSPMAVEAKQLQMSMQEVIDVTHNRLTALEARSSDLRLGIYLHAIYQRVYGVSLATMAILLCARRTLSPNDLALHVTAVDICHEVLRVCHDARAYRPLGAVWTVHALICTWCAVQDVTLKAKVEDALLDYQRDAMGPKAGINMDQLNLLDRRLRLLE